MTTSLSALYAEAWTEPRRSMRRILDMNLSERERLMMVGFSLVLFSIPLVLILRGLPPIPNAGELTSTVILIACAIFIAGGIIGYYFIAWLIHSLGARFGGTASLEDCRNVSAWSQLVTGIANVAVVCLMMFLPDILGMVARLVVSVAGLIVFSAYLAEAHGFVSVRKVAAVAFAVMFGVILLVNGIAMSGAPR